jgi:hypothetical protein
MCCAVLAARSSASQTFMLTKRPSGSVLFDATRLWKLCEDMTCEFGRAVSVECCDSVVHGDIRAHRPAQCRDWRSVDCVP